MHKKYIIELKIKVFKSLQFKNPWYTLVILELQYLSVYFQINFEKALPLHFYQELGNRLSEDFTINSSY